VFAVHVAGTALGLVGQVVLARWLGVADYGSFTYIHAWSLLLANVAGLGLTPGILRFLPQYQAQGQGRRYRAYLGNVRIWSLVAALVIVAILLLLAVRGYLGRYGEVWRHGAWLVLAFAFLNLHMQEGRAQGRMILAMAPQSLFMHATLLGGAGLLLLLRGSVDASATLAVFSAGLFLVVLIQGAMLRRSRPRLPDGESADGLQREWFRVGLPLFLILVFMYLLTRTDLLLVGSLLGEEAVGRYGAASKLATTVNFAFFAVNAAGAPVISALFAAGDQAAMRRMVKRTSNWVFWPALSIAIGLSILGRPILGLFGAEFQDAYGAMLILAGGYLATASMGLSPSLLNLTGNERLSALSFGIAVLINLALNLILIPRMGIEGAALATMLSMASWSVIAFFLARRKLDVNPFVLGGRAR
jgi:O-antigen/teichoic acid export membrane protein